MPERHYPGEILVLVSISAHAFRGSCMHAIAMKINAFPGKMENGYARDFQFSHNRYFLHECFAKWNKKGIKTTTTYIDAKANDGDVGCHKT